MKNVFRSALSLLSVAALLVTMAAGCGLTLSAVAADTVLYEENFDSYTNGTLPSGWTVMNAHANNVDVSVQDGALQLSAAGTTDAQTRVFYLGSELTNAANYTLEADYTIVSADQALTSSTRWSGFAVRVNSDATQYFYGGVRIRSGWNNEVSHCYGSAPATDFHQLKTATSSTNFALNETHKVKVYCSGTNLRVFLDDMATPLFNETADTACAKGYPSAGGIGFITSNLTVRIDNIKVTEVEVVETQPAFYDTYIPDTDIANPPSVITNITSAAVYEKMTGTKNPATAIYHLDSNLNVVTPDGTTKITTLKAALKKTNAASGNQVIPALYVKDTATVDALQEYAVSVAMNDAFLIADSVELLKYARGKMPLMYGALYTKLTAAATEEDLAAMIVNTNTAMGKTIIVDADYVTKDDVAYLQMRLMNVWVMDDGMTAEEAYDNIYKGANGLVATDHGMLWWVMEGTAFNSGTPVVIRETFMYAHRGYSSKAAQNTLEAFRAAAAYGADLVEMDVRRTSDGHVVLFHDETLQALTGVSDANASVENSTLAYLQTLTVTDKATGYSGKIMTLQEFLTFLNETDMVGIVEIKNDGDLPLVDLTTQIIKDMNMEHKVVSIAFDQNCCYRFRENLPGVSVGWLANASSKYTTPEAVINYAKGFISASNLSYHPNFGQISSSSGSVFMTDATAFATQRGFSFNPWTYNNNTAFDVAYVNGIQGITTDYLEYADGNFRKLQAYAKYQVKVGESSTLEALGFTHTGHAMVSCEFVRTGGADVFSSTAAGNIVANSEGTATGVLKYTVTTDMGYNYSVISDLVSVTATTGTIADPVDTVMHTTLLPPYVDKWQSSSTYTMSVARNSNGDVLTNQTGNWPSVKWDPGIYVQADDAIAYEIKVGGKLNITVHLSDGTSAMIQKSMGGDLDGDDLIGNGKTFKGVIALSDLFPNLSGTDTYIKTIEVYNVGDAGDQVILKQLDLVEKMPSSVVLYGDADVDGSVTTSDARDVLLHAVGKSTLTANGLAAADYDRNAIINSSDVRAILRSVVANA